MILLKFWGNFVSMENEGRRKEEEFLILRSASASSSNLKREWGLWWENSNNLLYGENSYKRVSSTVAAFNTF